MYAVVLATMLSVGGETPQWHNYRGCHGCHGCFGGCYGCSGCHGCYGCSGCYGCGGCWGCSGCYGCSAVYSYSCSGCYGCYGCYGCSGCYGCYGCSAVVISYPMYSGYSGCCGGVVLQPAAPQQKPETLKPPVKQETVNAAPKNNAAAAATTFVSSAPQPAEVIIRLPADAKLYVDNVFCPLTSDVRTFKTPQLEQNKKYFYNLRAEVVRNGQPRTETLRVFLTAGQQTQVEFTNLTGPVLVKR